MKFLINASIALGFATFATGANAATISQTPNPVDLVNALLGTPTFSGTPVQFSTNLPVRG